MNLESFNPFSKQNLQNRKSSYSNGNKSISGLRKRFKKNVPKKIKRRNENFLTQREQVKSSRVNKSHGRVDTRYAFKPYLYNREKKSRNIAYNNYTNYKVTEQTVLQGLDYAKKGLNASRHKEGRNSHSLFSCHQYNPRKYNRFLILTNTSTFV